MSNRVLCKGGCGEEATFNGWCKIKWVSGNKYGVACKIIKEKTARKISEFRIEEGKMGKNPMQNPLICAKNHSQERNRKAAESLKKLGKLKLLPQQIESKELKEKRRQNNIKAIQELLRLGKHPRQTESSEKKKERGEKISQTLIKMAKEGKLPLLNRSLEQKEIARKKASIRMREGIKSGKIVIPSHSWKKIFYNGLILRSGWEKTVAEYLDTTGYQWEYESLRVDYWDSQRNRVAITIPDFYIPKLNIIIEVKGIDLDPKQTEDKISGLNIAGYKTFLFRGKEIKHIQKNKRVFSKLLLGEYDEKS